MPLKMTKKTKKHFDYIVSLPPLNSPNLENVQNLEIVVSTSDRGAVSHALARKVSEGLNRESKNKTIKHTMNQLDSDRGGAGSYAYEIQTKFEENGVPISQSDSRYQFIQKAALADEIKRKRGGENAYSFFKIAEKYLIFYNSHNLRNQ